MKFTEDLLLPRIKRRNDPELENFIVIGINKELKKAEKSGEHCDLMQMQYFFESVFDDRDILEKINSLKS